MSLPAESFGDRFCMNRISRTEGSGWAHSNNANCMAAYGLSCRKALVGIRRPISVLFDKNGLRNEPSQRARPHFWLSRPFSQLRQVGIFQKPSLKVC